MQFHWLMLLITVLFIALTTPYFFRDQSVLKKRKTQSRNLLRENVIKQRIEKIAAEKVRDSKRQRIETLCIQAGFSLTYAEYLIISCTSGLITGIFTGMIMNNLVLAIVFVAIGYMIPNLIINHLKNRRIGLMDKQVGSFMDMTIKRYETTQDFSKAIAMTTEEFKGEEPLYFELQKTVLDISLGKTVNTALDELAIRTGNKFMVRLSDYYKASSEVGTDESRKKLLNQAYKQYDENRSLQLTTKKELASVKRDAYLMLFFIPGFAIFQSMTNDNYIDFMTNTVLGKVGTVVIFGVFMGSMWFINKKISGPLD